jgi:hypothetical protein
MVFFPQVSPLKPCVHPSSQRYVLHTPPITFFDLITRTIFGEQYRLLSSSVCSLLHSSLLGPNILSTPWSAQVRGLTGWFVTWYFYGEELIAPRPTPKLEDHPLSVVRDCLFAATLNTWRPRWQGPTYRGENLTTGFCSNMKIRTASADSKCRQPFTPLSKVWLSLSRFSRFALSWQLFGKNCMDLHEKSEKLLSCWY